MPTTEMKVVHVGMVNSSHQNQFPTLLSDCHHISLCYQELLRKTSDYSRQLNPAAKLRHFTVSVPPGWDFSQCSGRGDRLGTYSRPLSQPDILIGDSHPVFGSHPWTLQNQGCGKKGLLINLPQSFLQSTSLDSDVRGKDQKDIQYI